MSRTIWRGFKRLRLKVFETVLRSQPRSQGSLLSLRKTEEEREPGNKVAQKSEADGLSSHHWQPSLSTWIKVWYHIA